MKGSFYSFAALESKTKRKFHETRLLLMSDNVYCVDNDVEFNFIFFPPLNKVLYENVSGFTGLKRAWARRCHKTIEISQ